MNKIQAHPELQNVSLIGNSFFVDAIEINVTMRLMSLCHEVTDIENRLMDMGRQGERRE